MDDQQLRKILKPWIAKWNRRGTTRAIAKILALRHPSGASIKQRS
jgi:hypothetical protein